MLSRYSAAGCSGYNIVLFQLRACVMETRNFRKMLEAKWAEGKFVCVGLDSELSKLPKPYCGYETTAALTLFNKSIVDATKDLVCA